MTEPTWEQAIQHGPAGRLQEPYQTRWDSIAAGISHVYFASDEDYDQALGRELTEDEFDRLYNWDWERQKRVIAIAFFELLRLIDQEREACAKVCDGVQDCGPENGCCLTYWNESLERAAAAIRARGQA